MLDVQWGSFSLKHKTIICQHSKEDIYVLASKVLGRSRKEEEIPDYFLIVIDLLDLHLQYLKPFQIKLKMQMGFLVLYQHKHW